LPVDDAGGGCDGGGGGGAGPLELDENDALEDTPPLLSVLRLGSLLAAKFVFELELLTKSKTLLMKFVNVSLNELGGCGC
jgi:hypothetical protein